MLPKITEFERAKYLLKARNDQYSTGRGDGISGHDFRDKVPKESG